MSFQYQWWDVDVLYPHGRLTTEFKAKSKDHVIKQIKRWVKDSNSEENQSKPFWVRPDRVLEVYWDTLVLDRTGYQRRF